MIFLYHVRFESWIALFPMGPPFVVPTGPDVFVGSFFKPGFAATGCVWGAGSGCGLEFAGG